MPPNILFILTDQQRFDTCGCYGQPLEVTPNLDKMAKEGVIFNNAFSCQPVCGPARAVIQTGLYATETGCYRNCIALPLNSKSVAKYLSAEGYQTAYIGKWHLASTILPSKENIGEKFKYTKKAIPLHLRGGYDDFWLGADALEFTSKPYKGHVFDKDMNRVDFKGYRVDCLTDFALDYLDKREKNKPFFLFLSYLEPHHQNKYVFFGKFKGPKGSKEKYKDFDPPEDLVGLKGNWESSYPDYLGCCNSIDMNLSRILEKLKEQGILQDTIIIFTSDHGCHFKTRNSEYKRSCHEGSIHIPMIIKGPGFTGGKTVNELVSLIDIAPTILNIAGIDTPNHMQGKPLHNLIDGSGENWREEIFIQISESHVGRAIRTKKWKFSVKAPIKTGFFRAKSDLYYDDYLYDLENDPFERENLIRNSEYDDIREELREKLKKEMLRAGENIPKIMPRG